MKLLSKEQMDQVMEVVVLANTTPYLFKNLRRVLANLSTSLDVHELSRELEALVLRAENTDLEFQAAAYAVFVLFTFLEYNEVRPYLSKLRKLPAWGIAELIDLYATEAVPSFRTVLPTITPPVSYKPTADTNVAPTFVATVEHDDQ